MCVINGIIWKNRKAKGERRFLSAAQLAEHRGADHTGLYDYEQGSFVHHRLSIIDPDPRSHQPFENSSGTKISVERRAILFSLNISAIPI